MENEKLMEFLKDTNLSFYTKINNNVDNISKEQLKNIILSFCLQIPNYINSPTILKHFYKDVIDELEMTLKNN